MLTYFRRSAKGPQLYHSLGALRNINPILNLITFLKKFPSYELTQKRIYKLIQINNVFFKRLLAVFSTPHVCILM
jgi:hypothetical protein